MPPRQWRSGLPKGSIPKRWERFPPTCATRTQPPSSSCWRKASTRRPPPGPLSAGRCSSRYDKRSRPARSRRKRPTKSALKRRCAGRKANISSSSAHTPTRATCIITSISIPRLLTVPGNSIISSAPALPSGGCLTGFVWSMICP